VEVPEEGEVAQSLDYPAPGQVLQEIHDPGLAVVKRDLDAIAAFVDGGHNVVDHLSTFPVTDTPIIGG
jgi:hypothetical protein